MPFHIFFASAWQAQCLDIIENKLFGEIIKIAEKKVPMLFGFSLTEHGWTDGCTVILNIVYT